MNNDNTHTHKVNSLDEIIAKAKEYINQRSNWDLSSIYYENQGSEQKIGIVVKNEKGETADIYTFSEYGPKDEAYNKWYKEVSSLFPIELSKSGNQEKENEEKKEPEKQENTSVDHSKNNKSDNSSIIWIVAIILLVIIGVGVIYWYFKKK